MKYDFINKEALYREGSQLFLVRVSATCRYEYINVTISDCF